MLPAPFCSRTACCPDAMNAIVFEGVSKRFSKAAYSAIENATLEVQPGELIVLVGPSGCGKTTLLKMVNRLYEPTSGRILLGGQDIRSMPATRLRRGIGYVIQQVGLFPHITVARNIATVPELLGWDMARIEQRTGELLDLVRLPRAYAKRYPRQLSGGEQQRVGLARALAADPEILLMDEPFASLDAINRENLQKELLDIQQKVRKTILFVTHDVAEALHLADRLLILRAGRVVQYSPPLEAVADPANEFVHELLGSGDVLRRLSLLDVGMLLELRHQRRDVKQEAQAAPTILLEENLRSALARLLESGSDALSVLNSEGQPVAQIGFNDLRQVLRS
jgi:osmoprotectant transport system ATP-binding protein